MKMKSRPLSSRALVAMLVLGAAFVFAVSVIPELAAAAAVSVTSVTATSTNVYVNTGFATTSRVTTGDTVNYQLNLGGTPLLAPQINIFNMGSTTMTGSGASWHYATTSVTAWTEGPITFFISVGGTAGDATTTVSQSSVTTNVTYDKTAPTLNSVSWTDTDGSTQFSATDLLIFTFSETMATSTITAGNVDTTLGLSNSHTFGTSPTIAWNTAGNILTLTLGTSPTVADGDTVDPTTAVKDSVGIADATPTPLAIVDNLAPLTPVLSPNGSVFHGSQAVTITSTGSTAIHYTTDGTTPTCSSTLYSSSITFSGSVTLQAVGCDAHPNTSSVASAVFSPAGGGSSSPAAPATPAVSATPASSTTPAVPAAPAIPATPSANASGLSDAQIQSILDVLASFDADAATISSVKASLQGTSAQSATSAAVHAFKSNLTVGSLGGEVKALQEYLNAHGYAVASSGPGSTGSETTVFGSLTKNALMKLQKANGIIPAAGYFGPMTRAYVEAHP